MTGRSESASSSTDIWEEVADQIRARGGTLGSPLHHLSTTSSTNDDARRGAKEGATHGTAWVADSQTAGRGRRGRAWASPPGDGLLVSVLLRLSCPPTHLPPLAVFTGIAVREAVGRAAPLADVKIKWPNDVLVAGRKIAGILVEAITVGSQVEAVIVGIGINVHTRTFPGELALRATSVALVATAGAPTRASLLIDVLGTFERDLAAVLNGGLGPVRARLEAADGLFGCNVSSDSGQTGRARGIDDEGRLLVVRSEGDVARWNAGEAHLVRAPDAQS